MRLLTATAQAQGDLGNDFSHTTEGELVLVEEPCATDRRNPEGGCGCGRAFAGLSSHRATSTAMCRELDLSPGDVELAVAAYYTAIGVTPEVLGPADFAEVVTAQAALMAQMGSAVPVGTVVRRRLDHLVTSV